MVGGATWSSRIAGRKNRLDRPRRRPSKCPVRDLVELTASFVAAGAKRALMTAFGRITEFVEWREVEVRTWRVQLRVGERIRHRLQRHPSTSSAVRFT